MAVLSRSAKPRPMLTNYSYRYQLRDQKCRNTLPRWFTDANHNKDKTNISLSSHVSLWGSSACLCTASMKGSHLLLFPLSSKWNKAFCLLPRTKPFKLRLPRRNVYYQVSIWASHLAQRIGPNSTIFLCGSVFFLFVFLSCDFDGKHLKVRTPSLVTQLTRASVPHRVITEREKDRKCGPQARMKGDSLFSHTSHLSSSSVLSYRGFPSQGNLFSLFLTFSVCFIIISSETHGVWCNQSTGGCLRHVRRPGRYWVCTVCYWNKQNVSGKEVKNQKQVTFSDWKTVCLSWGELHSSFFETSQ